MLEIDFFKSLLPDFFTYLQNLKNLQDWNIKFIVEKQYSNFLNQPAKIVNSATSALFLILYYLKEYKHLNDLIIPAYGHISLLNVAKWLNFNIKFIDVDKLTYTLTEKELQNIDISNKIIIFSDLFGYCNEELIKIKKICEENNCILIENASTAFGQSYNNKKAGTIGDFGYYSFSFLKPLPLGEGGILTFKDEKLEKIFDAFIYHGNFYINNHSFIDYPGLNFMIPLWMYKLFEIAFNKKEIYFQEMNKKFLKAKQKFNLINFDSDNEYYFPYPFAFMETNLNKQKLLMKMKKIKKYSYINISFDNNFKNSQFLQENILFLKEIE